MKTNVSFLIFALTLSASAQIVKSVNITTNLSFSLQSWKAIGPQSKFMSNEEIIWGLLGTSTNHIWYRHFPSGNFDFHLFDQNGKEVSKTKAGLDLTATPVKPTIDELALTRKFVGYSVTSEQGEYRRLFRPDEMFVITNGGIYELKVQINLCVIMTNGAPDLNAMIDARNVTGRGFPFIKDFGVLTSSPLNVKIIKE
jgi:hypothetical protein